MNAQSFAPDFAAGDDTEESFRPGKPLVAVAAVFVLLLLAAAFIPFGGAVLAEGRMSVESRVKRIAHPQGGVISNILVTDGERVKQGQLLMQLDTTVSGVRADLSGRSVAQLMAQRARLEAERESRPSIRWPEALTSLGNADAADAMAGETRLFRLRREERAGLRSQLSQRVVQLQRQIAGYEAQIDALRQQQALIEPERAGVDDLWQDGLVTISRRNELERTAADLAGNIGSLEASIAQAGARITETREQIVQLDQTARAEAAAELARLNTELNQRRIEEASASDAYERSEIVAPYDGVIDKLAFAAPGEVVEPAQTIMEIVPDADTLVVESAISPADIDEVRAGQDATVRFTAISSARTPEVEGKVTFVSAERTENRQTGQSFYRARITLNPDAISEQGLELRAGMPAEVMIATGQRSMLSYLTKPLIDQFMRAFRD